MLEGWLDLAARVAAFAVFTVGMIAIVAVTTVIVRGPWWPTVLFQAGQRPRLVFWPLGLTYVVFTGVRFLPFGAPGLSAASLAWLFLAPQITSWWATRQAWTADDEHKRESARAVRNRLRDRIGEPEQPVGISWPQYIVDVARAERQAKYEPPGQEIELPLAPADR